MSFPAGVACASFTNCSAEATGLRFTSRITSPGARPASSAGLAGRTLCNRRALHIRRNMQLLPHIRSQFSDSQAQACPSAGPPQSPLLGHLRILVVLADLHIHRLRRAIANDAQRDRRARSILAHRNLQRAAVRRSSVHSARRSRRRSSTPPGSPESQASPAQQSRPSPPSD